MKRLTVIVLALALAGLMSCTKEAPAPKIAGTWKLQSRGVDRQGAPCPFIPDEMVFSKDGKVTMKPGPDSPWNYRTDVTDAEFATLSEKYTYVKDKDGLLLVRKEKDGDWTDGSIPYVYQWDGESLILNFPNFTPSRFTKAGA